MYFTCRLLSESVYQITYIRGSLIPNSLEVLEWGSPKLRIPMSLSVSLASDLIAATLDVSISLHGMLKGGSGATNQIVLYRILEDFTWSVDYISCMQHHTVADPEQILGWCPTIPLIWHWPLRCVKDQGQLMQVHIPHCAVITKSWSITCSEYNLHLITSDHVFTNPEESWCDVHSCDNSTKATCYVHVKYR